MPSQTRLQSRNENNIYYDAGADIDDFYSPIDNNIELHMETRPFVAEPRRLNVTWTRDFLAVFNTEYDETDEINSLFKKETKNIKKKRRKVIKI